jgi:hypothetical protein
LATPPLSDELAREAAEALKTHGRQYLAAKALGLHPKTLQSRLKTAAERGMLLDQPPAMPGFRIAQVTTAPDGKQHIQQKPEHGEVFEVPKGHVVKGVSALLDEDGRKIVEWVKTKQGERDPLHVADLLKKAFDNYVPAADPTPAPITAISSLLTLLPCNDWHVNMATWGKQTGSNWDLKIAEPTIGDAVVDVIARSPVSKIGVVLGGGDLMHINGKKAETANGTPQDIDSRYEKGLEVLQRLMVRTVDSARARYETVIVRILKGNHDEDPSPAIAHFLRAWYRNEPRVIVDTSPNLFWVYRFGSVMLAATHGHNVKIGEMPMIMAHRWAEDWGATKFRYAHGFHVHHTSKVATEGNGVLCETHQAPIPQDAWHYGSGYLSGRSLQAITYHESFGEIGRVRTAILDGDAE